MKLISWNVNGLRACLKKGFEDFLRDVDADILAFQETKMQESELTINFEGYNRYMNSAEKKGYSGTMVLTKIEPLNVTYGLGIEEHDKEGRMITLEFESFFFICVYVPNSKKELLRLDYRMTWEDDFRKYVSALSSKKPVIICGDLNVAHKEIDIKNPKSNLRSAGFTIEERDKMTALLDSGFIDTYRYLYPDKTDMYSWWSYMFHARENNSGWRIDYFLVSNDIKEEIKEAKILTDVYGSDHCPVELDIF